MTGLLICQTELPALGQSIPDINPWLDACNVSWDVPGPTSAQSMPIGNGDIGLNVWVEANGDLVFYISKTDAWSESNIGSWALLKLGGVRIFLNPRPAVTPFQQVLRLRTGEIQIQEGNTAFRVWVDANNPVIRVEATSSQPVSMTVMLNNWRANSQNGISADTVLANQPNQIVWYHRNPSTADSHLANRTFGTLIKGSGLVSANASTLQSATPTTSQVVSIYPLTTTTSTADQWLTRLTQQAAQVDALDLETTRAAHQNWWDQFWHRSWVFVRGDEIATNTTQGYILQRFVTACAGRGAYPIKFNGSIFTVDNPAYVSGTNTLTVNADYRTWGGQYWFQNTRPMYWPRLGAGDFDLMLPLFNMYAAIVPANAAQVTGYYGHGGAYFAETAPFWGGLQYAGPDAPEKFTLHYFTPILELSMMMLDYYDYTGDTNFAVQTLMPVAKAGLQFFDQHFGRDADGKLVLDPDNAIETYWKVHNPAPDIAGLRAILPRLMALPDGIVDVTTRATWTNLLSQVPPLPVGTAGNHSVLLPYTGPQAASRRNGENPELYAVYPFRLYGVGKPEFQMALDTFNARQSTFKGCWSQDPVHAAMLGLASVAKTYVSFNLTNTDARQKFQAFWTKANDYTPDEDNGGNGEHGLQSMLMQVDGKAILLLPAWPAGWDGDFKLHAPFQTTVQGTISQGRITNLVVTPPERAADVIDLSSLSADYLAGYNILSPADKVVALKQTRAGQPNVLAVSGTDFSVVESAANVLDKSLDTKYCNQAQDGTNAPGINTGFVVTPALGPTIITGFEFAAADDQPARDPRMITIEGSNASDAGQAGGNGFTLLYRGQCGLLQNPGRKTWGLYGTFANTTAYKSYRVLVTGTSGAADGAQYSEVKLLGGLQTPLPGNNILSTLDTVAALKQTAKGGTNVLAVSGTDFSATEPASNVRDGNTATKYFNKAKDGNFPNGVNTGFAITPSVGATVINGFQIATGNDMPERDPVSITLEGSNASDAVQAGADGFSLIWEGSTSLAQDPGRKSWGQIINFWNTNSYKTYRLLVTATAGAGGGAQYSEVKLLSAAPLAPLAPSSLAASAAASNRINLTWVDNAANETAFKIERKTGAGGIYSQIATVNSNITNYTDTGLSAATRYYYRVRASNAAGDSAYAVEAGATTLPATLINRATNGTASASAQNAPGQGAAMAFDGLATTKWFNNNLGSSGWLQYQFGGGLVWPVACYALISANDVPQRDPKDWQLLGSNDAATWTVLDTQTGQVFAIRYQTNGYTFSNGTPYQYYRLNILTNSGGSGYGLQLGELQLFTVEQPLLTKLAAALISPNQLRLTWATSGGTLYCTTNLLVPSAWAPATNLPVLSENEWVTTIPVGSEGSAFYRLQQ